MKRLSAFILVLMLVFSAMLFSSCKEEHVHTAGDWVADRIETCTAEGAKHKACTECGVTVETMVVPAKGHTEVIDSGIPATDTEDGLTEGSHCSVCGEVLRAQTVISANIQVVDIKLF